MDLIRKSEAEWNGDLMNGTGVIKLGSKAYEGPYSFKGRTSAESKQTNPEELIGAAHAGCFSMALSAGLSKAGHSPTSIHTTAGVHLAMGADGISIPEIDLSTEASVPGLTQEDFMKFAEEAKKTCPVSKALSAVKINFTAKLV